MVTRRVVCAPQLATGRDDQEKSPVREELGLLPYEERAKSTRGSDATRRNDVAERTTVFDAAFRSRSRYG